MEDQLNKAEEKEFQKIAQSFKSYFDDPANNVLTITLSFDPSDNLQKMIKQHVSSESKKKCVAMFGKVKDEFYISINKVNNISRIGKST